MIVTVYSRNERSWVIVNLFDWNTFFFRGEPRGSFYLFQDPPQLHHFSGTNIPMSGRQRMSMLKASWISTFGLGSIILIGGVCFACFMWTVVHWNSWRNMSIQVQSRIIQSLTFSLVGEKVTSTPSQNCIPASNMHQMHLNNEPFRLTCAEGWLSQCVTALGSLCNTPRQSLSVVSAELCPVQSWRRTGCRAKWG